MCRKCIEFEAIMFTSTLRVHTLFLSQQLINQPRPYPGSSGYHSSWMAGMDAVIDCLMWYSERPFWVTWSVMGALEAVARMCLLKPWSSRTGDGSEESKVIFHLPERIWRESVDAMMGGLDRGCGSLRYCGGWGCFGCLAWVARSTNAIDELYAWMCCPGSNHLFL